MTNKEKRRLLGLVLAARMGPAFVECGLGSIKISVIVTAILALGKKKKKKVLKKKAPMAIYSAPTWP